MSNIDTKRRVAYVELIREDPAATTKLLATYAESHHLPESDRWHFHVTRCAEQDYIDGLDACCFPEFYEAVQGIEAEVSLDRPRG